MKRIALLILVGLSLSACVAPPTPRSAETPAFYLPLARDGAQVDAASAREMVSAYRRNQGLGPLGADPELQAIAEAEARTMAAADRPGSADAVKARLAATGFNSSAVNLSAGYYTLAEAFSGWRESPQHNRVLLDRQATRMGIATAYSPRSKYKVYWVMVAAAGRRP